MKPKQIFLLTGLIVLLLGGIVVLIATSNVEPENGGEGSTSQQGTTASLSISEQAETIELKNLENQPFSKFVLDPFLVKDGVVQKVIVVPNSEISKMSAKLTDGNGEHQQEMKEKKFQGQKAYYLKWNPENLTSGEDYPVKLKAVTPSESIHTFTISWEAK